MTFCAAQPIQSVPFDNFLKNTKSIQMKELARTGSQVKNTALVEEMRHRILTIHRGAHPRVNVSPEHRLHRATSMRSTQELNKPAMKEKQKPGTDQ